MTVTILAAPDTEPPQVMLAEPGEGDTVSGSILVQANATDNVGVASIEFFIGATSLGTVTTPPYELTWDSTSFADGPYAVKATATDSSGNGASSTVNVNVDNSVLNNVAPAVEAGDNQTIELPTNSVNLAGIVTDDGLPSGILNIGWSVMDAPPGGSVIFADQTAAVTTATFDIDGVYELRLRADDSLLVTSD